MSRPGHVLVEFPIDEARALLAQVDGRRFYPYEHSDLLSGFARLARAMKIELQVSGSCYRPDAAHASSAEMAG